MSDGEIKNIVEALLMSANKPLTIDDFIAVFGDWQKPEAEQIIKAINALTKDYEPRAIELKQVASGYRLQTKARYGSWVSQLQLEKATKYSKALLETLAIIVYQQPVTRAEIENIRGVAVSSLMLKTLVERGWITTAGHRDVPGKPAVYITGKAFLDYFNLTSLNDLPPLPLIASVLSENLPTPIVESIET